MTSTSNSRFSLLSPFNVLLRQWFSLLGVISLLVLLIWGGLQIWQMQRVGQPAIASEVRSLIISGFSDRSELATVKMATKATVVTHQERQLRGLKVGDTHVVYEGVGTVQAGLDIQQIQVESLDRTQGRIRVVLPPPYITDIALDINRSSTLAHYRQWFGPNVELELQEQAQADALRQIKAEACKSDILIRANQKAKQLIEEILSKGGFTQITIETQIPVGEACPLRP
jgi:hypothetical protein